jgi:O-antigen/teichoic acid export membrane protein
MGYKKTAFFGLSWMMSLNIITGVFSVLKIAIVARLLSPTDFGVFGIALLALSLLELLTETGLNVVLIQSQRDLSKYLDSAWIVSIIRGILITIALVILSPLISSFFHSPQSLWILLLISLAPLLRGFINPSEIIFQKELRFSSEFFFRIAIFAVDMLVSIALVLLTKSVAALVWGMLAGVLLELIISFVFIKPTPKFSFNKEYLAEIFHKGKWVTAYGLFNYAAQNSDDIAVGKILGVNPLGIYQVAYKISTFVLTEIADVVNKVFFPLYSQMADDKEKLRKVFLQSISALSLVVIPVSLLIFIFPKEIITVFLGDKWIGAVNILKVLTFYGMARAIIGYPSALFLAVGHQKYVAYMTFTRAFALIVLIVPMIYFFGIMGAAYSAIISVVIEAPIVVCLLFKVLKK